MASLFTVDDPSELNALVRALLAAKSYAPDDGPELAGSPLLAALCERAMDALVAAEAAGHFPRIGGLPGTADAVQSPPGPVVASARRYLSAVGARGGNWSRWSMAERADYVRLVFRPYVSDEALVAELAGSGLPGTGAAPD